MKTLKNRGGLTFIELIISSAVSVFMLVASVNLISFIYKSITTTKIKALAYETAVDNANKYKNYGFSSLKVNPENQDTHAQIEAANNPYYFEAFTYGGTSFKIFKKIQYAQEDNNGNLVSIPLNDGTISDLKMITIDVVYFDNHFKQFKTVQSIAYCASRDVPFAGSSISGTLTSSGSPVLDMTKNPMVYVSGRPELTTAALNDSGIKYTIENLQPGKYSLWAEAFGYYPATYTANPVSITNTVAEITGINITLPPADTGMLTGTAYMANKVTLKATALWNGGVPHFTSWEHTEVPFGAATIPAEDIIGESDLKNIYTSDHTSINIAQTQFAPIDIDPVKIVEVILNVSFTAQSALPGDKLRVYLNRDPSGGNNYSQLWSWQPNAWGIAAASDTDSSPPHGYYYDIDMLSGSPASLDITSLYNEHYEWNSALASSLGAAIRAIGSGFNPVRIDSMWLDVYYALSGWGQVEISANDGLSSATTADSQGRYTLSNVLTGPATNTIEAYAVKSPDPFSSPFLCIRKNIVINKDEIKTVNFALTQADPGSCYVSGFVIDQLSNLGINLAVVTFKHSETGVEYNTTSGSGGAFALGPIPAGYGTLKAAKANYAQSSTSSFNAVPFTSNKKIFMNPTGKITGRVTHDTTSAPIPNIQISAKRTSGGLAASGVTNSDGYFTVTVTAGDTYKLEPDLEYTGYYCAYPPLQKIINIDILNAGDSSINNNFRLNYDYKPISGSLDLSGLAIDDPVLIIAQPSSNTVPPHGVAGDYFSTTHTGKAKNTLYRALYPTYSITSKFNGTYIINVPFTGENYDLYAYYTRVSFAAQEPFTRTYINYFKKLSSVAPGTTGSSFSGSWTEY